VDGGYTPSIPLALGVPNDGSEWIVVPNNVNNTSRVIVICADNIFFDMSNSNFSIANQGSFSELYLTKRVEQGNVTPGSTLDYSISLTNTGNLAASATITDTFDSLLVNTECDGVPGDLMDSLTLNPGIANASTYDCSAQVDPTLAVEINKTVDKPIISGGEAVTYTITITNPNTVTLENVTVSDPDVGSCSPNIGTPISLSPGGTQTYVCPDNVLNEDTTNTATVSAEYAIDNTATSSCAA
jgi:uncharacterized repeat protein (TIGR01451 family)